MLFFMFNNMIDKMTHKQYHIHMTLLFNNYISNLMYTSLNIAIGVKTCRFSADEIFS